jgi:hypothetical protein
VKRRRLCAIVASIGFLGFASCSPQIMQMRDLRTNDPKTTFAPTDQPVAWVHVGPHWVATTTTVEVHDELTGKLVRQEASTVGLGVLGGDVAFNLQPLESGKYHVAAFVEGQQIGGETFQVLWSAAVAGDLPECPRTYYYPGAFGPSGMRMERLDGSTEDLKDVKDGEGAIISYDVSQPLPYQFFRSHKECYASPADIAAEKRYHLTGGFPDCPKNYYDGSIGPFLEDQMVEGVAPEVKGAIVKYRGGKSNPYQFAEQCYASPADVAAERKYLAGPLPECPRHFAGGFEAAPDGKGLIVTQLDGRHCYVSPAHLAGCGKTTRFPLDSI